MCGYVRDDAGSDDIRNPHLEVLRVDRQSGGGGRQRQQRLAAHQLRILKHLVDAVHHLPEGGPQPPVALPAPLSELPARGSKGRRTAEVGGEEGKRMQALLRTSRGLPSLAVRAGNSVIGICCPARGCRAP
jgi:hypothetical protein